VLRHRVQRDETRADELFGTVHKVRLRRSEDIPLGVQRQDMLSQG
jgi:hypothetical protein